MGFSRQQKIVLGIVPPIAAAIIRLLGSTLRFQEVCAPGAIPGDKTAPPGVFGFWHRSLLMAAYRFRDQGIGILISASFDGELIARTVQRLGFHVVRGSSSRGGASGLLAMQKAVEEGRIVAFTADGPRGPVYVAKPGFAALAQQTTGVAGAFHLVPKRAWELKSWDRFLIPKPFTTVAIGWPNLIQISGNKEIAQQQCQQILDQARAMAEEAVR